MVYRAENCQGLLENCLGLPLISEFARADLDGVVLRLDLAITEMKPGNRLLRWYEGWRFFGIGHAWVQIEGVLSRQFDNKPLLKFVHRRRNAGIRSLEFLGLPLLSCEYSGFAQSLVGQLIRRMAHDILMELDHRLNRAP